MIFLPDTHFFLHFKDAGELPWSEITADDEVRLVVCHTIQKEIDEKKYTLRGRPQKRARKFASLMGQIAVDSGPLVLRERAPRVTLDYFDRWPAGWEAPVDLRRNWNDDLFVADVLAFMNGTDEAVAVLTNDVGVYRTAEAHGVQPFLLKDHWRLPDEADERGKEIARLKAEVAEHRRNEPDTRLILEVGATPTEAQEIGIEVVTFPPLAPERIQALMDELRARHPAVTDFGKPGPGPPGMIGAAVGMFGLPLNAYEDRPPSTEDIRVYTEQAYPAWLQEAEAYLETLHDRLQARTLETRVCFLLSNQGTVPAEDVILEFEALGGPLLAEIPTQEEADEAEKPSLALPPPPAAPRWTRVRKPGLLSIMEALQSQARSSIRFPSLNVSRLSDRDPQAFYWKERSSEPTTRWSFTCADFRHQGQPERFGVRILVRRDDLPSGDASIRVTLSARNLRERFERIVPVRVTYQQGDTEAEAWKLMRLRPTAIRVPTLHPKTRGPSAD